MTITQASISELAPYDKRERYMAAFAAIGGLAWTLGPFIAAFLSNSSLFPFLTYATPFWFLAILFFIALFLIIKSFKFEASQVEKEKIEFLKTFSRLMEIFKYPNVATPFLASLIAMFGWMMYQGFLGSYLIEKLQFNEQFEGYAYAFSSLFWFFGGALAQLSILKHY
ncbi:MAG: MFS transporter, partial [Simkania negevensis]|nr:MFS transporter [Simkania negevensis]